MVLFWLGEEIIGNAWKTLIRSWITMVTSRSCLGNKDVDGCLHRDVGRQKGAQPRPSHAGGRSGAMGQYGTQQAPQKGLNGSQRNNNKLYYDLPFSELSYSYYGQYSVMTTSFPLIPPNPLPFFTWSGISRKAFKIQFFWCTFSFSLSLDCCL